MQTGISVYFSDGLEANQRLIDCAASMGARCVFTSMHIPEDAGLSFAQDARRMLETVSGHGMELLVDIGPETCGLLGCASVFELAQLGITHVRPDYGFSDEEVVALSKEFFVAFNASTVTRAQLLEWTRRGADLERLVACHNFYPKPFSGLALDEVRRMNERFASLGLSTMGFVPGDGHQRGPLFEGLCTVEEHRARKREVARNMLELANVAGCDVVMVGDPGLSEEGWRQFLQISAGCVDIQCSLEDGYEYLYGLELHDRVDASSYVFRESTTRRGVHPKGAVPVDTHAGAARPAGSIALSNTKYARYEGELEIARVELPGDERMNVVGQVRAEDLPLVALARKECGLRLVPLRIVMDRKGRRGSKTKITN